MALPYSLKRTTDPTAEPVSLAELKNHLRLDHNDDDTRIADILASARERVELDTQRSLITQTWTLKLDEWPTTDIILYYPPLSSVTSIKYTDTAGVTQTWSSGEYVVDTASEPARVYLDYSYSWPDTRGEPQCIEVIYVTGYGAAASSVPQELRQAVLLAGGLLYDGHCDNLLASYNRIVQARCVPAYPGV